MPNKILGRTKHRIILVDTMNNIEMMLNEISYTDYLQAELDYGNKNIFKNFKLYLVMQEDTIQIGDDLK